MRRVCRMPKHTRSAQLFHAGFPHLFTKNFVPRQHEREPKVLSTKKYVLLTFFLYSNSLKVKGGEKTEEAFLVILIEKLCLSLCVFVKEFIECCV